MNNRAKTYNQFINEAHITPSGDLEGLEFNKEEELELSMVDELNTISDFLEDSGADRVRLDMTFDDQGEYSFFFEFRGGQYQLLLDTEADSHPSGEVTVYDISNGTRPIEILRAAADSFFDLLSANGLDFL